MSSIVEVVAPARLGTGFRWLLASSWVSNLGDGLAIAAAPLLIASQTRDPFLVALAALLQQLPWLVFGLHAGAIADRLNRRLIVVAVDGIRTVVLVLLALSILTGTVSVPVVLGAVFLVGTAEVFADSASQTLLPMLVHRSDLVVGRARLQVGFVTVNQLLGPPLGAALFATGMALPFFTQAVLVGAGAVLISRIVLTDDVHPERSTERLWRDIVEGYRWTVHHAAVRTLVLTIFIFNITFGAAWSVLVLYARDRLGMGSVGYGLLTTAGALGGIVGMAVYGWLTRRISLGNLMRIGLVLETLTHLGLALTTSPAVALAIMFGFGAHAFIWGTTSATVRQRAVPNALQGRVGSLNAIGTYGGMIVGSGLGGLIARAGGVVAPFWFAFAGSALFVVLLWGQLTHIAHADADLDTEPAPAA